MLVLAVALLAGWVWASHAASGPTYLEYDVKAAALQKFATFVEWPPSAFADPKEPLVIGILGNDPFGTRLEAMLSNKTVHGRALAFKRFAKVEDALQTRCHLLFIRIEKTRLPSILEKLKAAPILTVGDTAGYGEAGVMINLAITPAGTLKFEVDLDRTKAAGLKLGSQLLDLATNRPGRPKAGE